MKLWDINEIDRLILFKRQKKKSCVWETIKSCIHMESYQVIFGYIVRVLLKLEFHLSCIFYIFHVILFLLDTWSHQNIFLLIYVTKFFYLLCFNNFYDYIRFCRCSTQVVSFTTCTVTNREIRGDWSPIFYIFWKIRT